jgi:hypothetical protein
MKITKVCCQGCGADLQVDETVRYVTCNYCHARLEVVHDPSVTHTRLMEKLEKTTERMADNLRVIELQNDLERIDREWEQRREGFMVTGKHGHRSLPSTAGSAVGGGFAALFGIIWTVAAGSMGAPAPFVLFGLVFVGLAIFNAVNGASKANAHQSAEALHQRERAELLRKIEAARREKNP